MAMPNRNTEWAVDEIGVDMWSNEESCEVVVTYRHTAGHYVQHITDFTLCGDVQVNDERPDYALDCFVVDVDETFARAISEAAEAGDDTVGVDRSFFIYPSSEVYEPLDTDREFVDDGMDHREQVEDGWINLDYTGPYETDDKTLDAEIETRLKAWGKNLAEVELYAGDLNQVWSDLTAA